MEERKVVPDGVLFQSERSARIYADQHDKDVVEVDGGWLARNRACATQKGPMPTKEGDVIVQHLNQLFRVWLITSDGAQGPDRNVAPLEKWNRAEAEQAAREWMEDTGGRIFLLQKDGEWTIMPT